MDSKRKDSKLLLFDWFYFKVFRVATIFSIVYLVSLGYEKLDYAITRELARRKIQ